MIFGETGHAGKGVYVLGLPWTPSYLLDCSRPVLFEAGFSCAGRLYEEDIKKAITNRQPEMVFLTHAHFDHSGATAYFKKIFPNIKIAASLRAAEIIKRPNAQKLIKELSSGVIERVTLVKGIDSTKLLHEPFEPFEVDIILEDGQFIQLTEDISIQVISTAGHTRDQLSYYIPERRILFATESVGCLNRIGQIIPEFLVDYDLYITNLKALSLLDIEVLCLGHQFAVTDHDVKEYLARSVKEAEHFRVKVEEMLDEENGAIDRVVNRIKNEEYDINPGPKQLEQAYLINATTRVAHLAERLMAKASPAL